MSVKTHVEQLIKKHAELEKQILTEQQRPLPDTIRISCLKREKLQLKDQIESLARVAA